MDKQKLFWLLLLRKRTSYRNLGFSLIEKLITLVIATIITTGLVGLITQFIQSDQQEAAFLATEKDTQIALDYITEDLREAVFVYEEISSLLIESLPEFENIPELGPSSQPVLIFWKTEPVPPDQLPSVTCQPDPNDPEEQVCSCPQFADELEDEECRLLNIKRHVYTLVVYVQTTDEHEKWLGKSRLVRYALPKYSNPAQLEQTIGFVDPAIYGNFVTWPKDKDGINQQQERPNPGAPDQPNPMVLVDFIDSPDRSEFFSEASPNLPPPPETCPNEYSRVPSQANVNNSFFACVRKSRINLTDTDVRVGVNQDIIVFLRGNSEGRDRLIKEIKHNIPSLRAQVTLRGVIDKKPTNQ
ncbi:PilW family protein [Gloeocapsa sp. PCC 73106]|uniref:PilW family protein n=1 Tax=Gloeocapsa sp. PCC 73106 TaxID=102232 RepID=UPI0002AC9927|nr:hypothetical protein [Gloeocapsa sp. PCC 73106]ELR97276.1 hypothetical protein GLO73106DRAFT_00010840 [Gloeocapsa sp. PCC 73106]